MALSDENGGMVMPVGPMYGGKRRHRKQLRWRLGLDNSAFTSRLGQQWKWVWFG